MNAYNVRSHRVGSRARLAASALLLGVLAFSGQVPPRPAPGTQFIVQANSLMRASSAVTAVGGRVSRELGIIEAVSATLTAEQEVQIAQRCSECRVYSDRATKVMSQGTNNKQDTAYPTLIGAASLHQNNITGLGVTVAMIDSGFLDNPGNTLNSQGLTRIKAQYDAFTGEVRTSDFVTDDEYGHGSHIVGIIGGSEKTASGLYQGVAPDVDLVSVKAFDANGASTYTAVIDAIGWVIAHKAQYNIRVMNGSFGAQVGSWYWDDPMNQAIMKAWQAGIVVVVSAGNSGPDPMTILAPGNVPYVITVGAMTDHYTPNNGNDDSLATFSAAGPTYEAHAKPDLVAPGGHDLSLIQRTSTLGTQFPQFFIDSTSEYYRLSGTSQAAAVVSGVAALMLQANPNLSPDDVKCGMMATATAAMKPNGGSAYSVFQQGSGLVRADTAVIEGHTGCANTGLDINADLAGTQHFAGMAAQLPDGTYYLADAWGAGSAWSGAAAGTKGYPWSNGFPWSNGYPWANGFPWSNGYPWANGYPWSDHPEDGDSITATESTMAADAGLAGGSRMKAGNSLKPGKEAKPRKYPRVPGKGHRPNRSRIEVVKPADQQ